VKRRGTTSATVVTKPAMFSRMPIRALFSLRKGEIGVNLLTYKPGDEDGYFMFLASPASM